MATHPYKYPVTDKFQARAVTQPDFEPNLFKDELYVNLDEVRGDRFRQQVLFALNIDTATKTLRDTTDDFVKIIFSGHRGCGKTTELRRLDNYLDSPARYLSVLLELEKETEYGTLQPYDVFIWILLKLVEVIKKKNIPVEAAAFNKLARLFQTSETVEQEQKKSGGAEISAEGGWGLNWLFTLSLKAKSVFASTTSESKKIREEVKQNTVDIIQQINDALAQTREAVVKNGQGQDLLFIIDGSEKLNLEVYEFLFIKNPNLLRKLNLNMILAIPIDTYYQIGSLPGTNLTQRLTVPMIKLDKPGARACFREVISKRLDVATFFEDGALELCVDYSGGCMLQLLNLVNLVIRLTLGERASHADVQDAIAEYRSYLSQVLTSDHVALLKTALADPRKLDSLHTGDEPVREMLLQLVLLKYNGHMELNPVLEGHIV